MRNAIIAFIALAITLGAAAAAIVPAKAGLCTTTCTRNGDCLTYCN